MSSPEGDFLMLSSPWLTLLAASAAPLLGLVAAGPETPAGGEGAWQKSPSGLETLDVKAGDGVEARSGSTVDVHYTGWLDDGTEFDSSRGRGKPLTFRLGAGMVIRGWDEGIAGMRPGGVRKLRIPPDLAYGTRGAAGVIPPGASLHFEVELVAVR
jgi:FKBP-type peptidyl-prolyl cis-trans isomerase